MNISYELYLRWWWTSHLSLIDKIPKLALVSNAFEGPEFSQSFCGQEHTVTFSTTAQRRCRSISQAHRRLFYSKETLRKDVDS